jgi:septal ring factor EnvC (AmiA/AmiB activator)
MMHGDSSLNDEKVDLLFEDPHENDTSPTTAITLSTASNDKDLTAAITAALSDDDDDEEDIGSMGEETDELINFLAEETADLNIIDEAMNLLQDEVEEAVNNFTNSKSSIGNDDGTQASVASLSSIALAADDDENDDGERTGPDKKKSALEEEARMVPIQQFENALALIQDLEKQVDTLEAVKHQLQFENAQLRQETETQQQLIASYEKKLSEFPKLMEATVEEQSAVAAEIAKGAAKQSFWNDYMSRQEELSAQEKKERRKTATTTSLKQSDFLKNVVERQEKERSSLAPSSFLQGWKTKFHSMSGGGGGPLPEGGNQEAPSSNVYNGGNKINSRQGSQHRRQQHEDDTGIAADDAKNPNKEDAKMLSLLT